MNVAAINQGTAGGPVGGGMMLMNNSGSPATQMNASPGQGPEELKRQFNTFIYEYFLKIGLYDVARILHQQPDKFKLRLATKPSPAQRKNGEVNGIDADAMDMDMKNDIPDDLPRPECPQSDPSGHGFLFEWFGIFSDLLTAARPQNKGHMNPAAQYLNYTQNAQRIRENQQNPNLIRQGMMNNQYAMRAGMRPGMVNGAMQPGGDMSKRLTPQQVQQVQMMKQQQMQQQMQREGAEVDMAGRPGTPAEGENGGSPSKRPRLENQQFNGGMMPNGRPMPNQQGAMMIQNSFNPNINPAQFRQNAGMPGQKPMQPGMPNGMMNMNSAGSPMMPMNGGQFGSEMAAMEMYNSGRMGGQPMQGGPAAAAAQSGNHALQDYQMQLMLLEQQNKKRLMMARQEQDNAVNRDGAPMPVGMGAAGMSPSGGSRSGTSPNPTEQMKRTPQMGGLPGSPAAGENMQGRSPAPMGFMNGMPGSDFNPAMFMGDKPGMVGPGGPNMRAPTSMDMNMARQQGRMGGQFQGGQPMVQQPSQPGQQPMGTPGQRNEMPPPQAPAGGSAQRNQPASPAQSSNAPPTPSQSNKANPKGKKGKADNNANNSASEKKKPTKKTAAANAPAENEPPVTPTPSTPITPQHPNSFGNAGVKGQAAAAPTSAPQAAVQQMPPSQQSIPQPDLSQTNAYQDFDNNQNFNLDFSTLDNSDVLENFDFDSFLNTSTDDAFNFDGSMTVGDFDLNGPTE